MSFTLNPCKACKERCKDDEGINELNSCVVETSAAFQNDFPNNDVLFNDGTAGAHWAGCMKDAMDKMGRAPCNFQLNPAPVFVQAPHYFPSLLKESGDIKKSYKQCLEYCEYNPHNKRTCATNCKTDMMAVEMVSNNKHTPMPKPKPTPKPTPKPMLKPMPKPTPKPMLKPMPTSLEKYHHEEGPMKPKNKDPYKKAMKKNPMAFWFGFLIMGIIGAFLISIVVLSLFTNKLDPKSSAPMLKDGDIIVVEF